MEVLYGILIFLWIMIIAAIPRQDTIGCANIKTYPECAKFCTHDAVATCESSVKRRISEAADAIQQSGQQLNRKSTRDYDHEHESTRDYDHEHEPTTWETIYGCKQEVWLMNKCGKE